MGASPSQSTFKCSSVHDAIAILSDPSASNSVRARCAAITMLGTAAASDETSDSACYEYPQKYAERIAVLLKDRDDRVRRLAVETLGSLRDGRCHWSTAPAVAPLLADPDEYVRAAAAIA